MFTTWKTIHLLPSPDVGQMPISSSEKPTRPSSFAFANVLISTAQKKPETDSSPDAPFMFNRQPGGALSQVTANPLYGGSEAATTSSESVKFPTISTALLGVDADVQTAKFEKEILTQIPTRFVALSKVNFEKPLTSDKPESTEGQMPYRFVWPSPLRISIPLNTGNNARLDFHLQEARYYPITLASDVPQNNMPAEKNRVMNVQANGKSFNPTVQPLPNGGSLVPLQMQVSRDIKLSNSLIFSGKLKPRPGGFIKENSAPLSPVNSELVEGLGSEVNTGFTVKWVVPLRERSGESMPVVLQVDWPGGERVEFVGKLKGMPSAIPLKEPLLGDLRLPQAQVAGKNVLLQMPVSVASEEKSRPDVVKNATLGERIDGASAYSNFPSRLAESAESIFPVGQKWLAEAAFNVKSAISHPLRPGRPVKEANPYGNKPELPSDAQKGWQRIGEVFRRFSEPVIVAQTTTVYPSFRTESVLMSFPVAAVKHTIQPFSHLDKQSLKENGNLTTRPASSIQKDAGMAFEAGSNKTTTSEGGRITQSLFFGEKPLNHPVYSTIRQGMDSAPKTWGHSLSMTDMTESFPSLLKNWIAQVRYSGQAHRQEIWIKLRPASLGLVRIRLKMEGERLTGKVEASHPEALRVLQHHYQQLMDRLRESQIEIQQFDLDLNRDLQEEPTMRQQDARQSLSGDSHPANEADIQTPISENHRIKQPRWLGYNTIDYLA